MNKNNSSPPSWADRILRMFCPSNLVEELLGDLYEQFDDDRQQLGESRARWRYVLEVVKFAKPYFLKRRAENVVTSYSKRVALQGSLWGHKLRRSHQSNEYSKPLILSPDMIRNYLTVARRNLVRHKSYTFINVAGLMLGMVCAILIFSFVNYHLGFDRFH